MDIKASDVKQLRDKTGAGMMECKKALQHCNGDAKEAEKVWPLSKSVPIE